MIPIKANAGEDGQEQGNQQHDADVVPDDSLPRFRYADGAGSRMTLDGLAALLDMGASLILVAVDFARGGVGHALCHQLARRRRVEIRA